MPYKVHRKALIVVCLLVSLLVGLSVAMGKAPESFAKKEKPEEAIDFTLKDLNGKFHTLSQYRGKYIFLNFWATWCPPCRREMPSMQQMYEDSDKDKFVMLAVSVREPAARVINFVEENAYTFPVLLDPVDEVAHQYRVNSYPTTFIIDEKGKIMGRISGARLWSWEDFEKLIK
ncbi:MAG: TlpA disulfide reductase family protein [Candidatus Margulisiibacteriota bacterium]